MVVEERSIKIDVSYYIGFLFCIRVINMRMSKIFVYVIILISNWVEGMVFIGVI